jgi:hypothetical protein
VRVLNGRRVPPAPDGRYGRRRAEPQMGDRDDDQDDAEAEPVTATVPASCCNGEAGHRTYVHKALASRSVWQACRAGCDNFLYTLKAGLRAAACGGRPRPADHRDGSGGPIVSHW